MSNNDHLAMIRKDAAEMMPAFIAHDLKNIASVLSLTLHNMKRQRDEPAFHEELIRTLTESVNKMNLIVRRLSGLHCRVEIRRRPVAFRIWYEEMMQSMNGQMPGLLHWQAPPDRLVHMDAEQLRTVLHNIIANARDASMPGELVRVSAESRNGSVLICVRDRGTGMSREFIDERLFLPFQTTKPDGMGIGLYQARMITEAHGGRIAIDSVPGEGTSVEVWLPAEL